jgi:hypothetical protein
MRHWKGLVGLLISIPLVLAFFKPTSAFAADYKFGNLKEALDAAAKSYHLDPNNEVTQQVYNLIQTSLSGSGTKGLQ